jgi:hypothetical protein
MEEEPATSVEPVAATDSGQEAPARAGQLQAALIAARAVREDAEAEADEIRRAAAAEADVARTDGQRLAARRLQEAELAVAKARRTMAVAEEKAAFIISNALAEADRIVAEATALVHRSVAPQEVVIDITDAALVEAAAAANAVVADDVEVDADADDLQPRREATELDRLLGKAIHKAVAKLAQTWDPKARLVEG